MPLPGLRFERLRSDIEVLSRAGLEFETFLEEAVASVQRAVPWDAACIVTHDPTTRIMTSARKYGDLVGRNDGDTLFGQIEYDSGEQTTYRQLLDDGVTTVGMHLLHDGEIDRSERMSRLLAPEFGYADEARLLFRDGDRLWGGLAVFRGPDDAPFDTEDLDFLAGLGDSFVRGVRSGILARLGSDAGTAPEGPAVVIVDRFGRIGRMTPAAELLLAEMAPDPQSSYPADVIHSLVAEATRAARGEGGARAPWARVQTQGGRWLVLHAAMLDGIGGQEVVVTIEAAKAPQIAELLFSAIGLTAREKEVTGLVIRGLDTRRIASTLGMSPYTVQDHLKAVFEKVGVRSRGELVAKVYFEQYAPRFGEPLGADGSFL